MKKLGVVVFALIVSACGYETVPSGVTRYNGHVTQAPMKLSTNVQCGSEYYDPVFQKTYIKSC